MRAVLILAVACLAHAQVYEVASIKPSKGGGPPGPRTSVGGRLNATNTTLKSLTEFAWDVRSYQISGGPPWLDSAGWAKKSNRQPGRKSLRKLKAIYGSRA